MADVKISELTAGASLSGSETVPVVQSATTVRTTAQDIANLAPVTSVAGRTGVVTLTSVDVGISSTDISLWNTAYGWGDHGIEGYITLAEADARYLQTFTESDPVYAASSWYTTTNNASQWNTAYGWGDHSAAGYSTFSGSYTDLTNKPTLFDGAYSSLTGTPTIPAALTDLGITDGSSGQVLTTNGAGTFTFTTVSGGGGIALTDLSVSVAAAGTANLSYNNTNGTFTYTPPDLSSYSTFSGSYTDLTNKPTLFDGAYSSLTGTPTIPSALTDLGISDGTSGQVLSTNGAGTFTFVDAASGGSGTVTSVALSVPTGLSVSGSPVTTSGTLTVSAASGYEVPKSASLFKVWVNFNGTGTVAIRDSFNVSSVTDNGTGDYTVNFSITMPNANFGIMATAGRGAAGGEGIIGPGGSNPTTTTVRIQGSNYQNADSDREYTFVGITSSS